jgi:hypothetical protein
VQFCLIGLLFERIPEQPEGLGNELPAGAEVNPGMMLTIFPDDKRYLVL